MLEQSLYRLADPDGVRRVIDAHPWATLVTATATEGLVVSHLPVIVEPGGADPPVVLGHLARRDAEVHGLGRHAGVLVVEGPHGYVSPSLYAGGPYVPTWNYVVVHLHGRPEPLGASDTYDVLDQTVDRLERDRHHPWRLDSVAGYARTIASGVAGFRLTPDRVVAKAKLSQDKPAADVAAVIDGFDRDPVHGNAALAAAMRAHGLVRASEGVR